MQNLPPPYVGIIFAGDECLGTGFLVDSSLGLLATAYHVIYDSKKGLTELSSLFFQPFGQSERYPIKALLGSRPADKEDVALLEIEPPDIHLLPKLSTHLIPTSNVWLVGFASERGIHRDFKSSQGKIIGPTLWNGCQVLELDMEGIYRGMSGAPVHSPNGEIVGILTDRVNEYGRPIAFATPIGILVELDQRVETPRRKYLNTLISRIILEEQSTPFSLKEYVPSPVVLSSEKQEKTADEQYTSILKLLEQRHRFALIGEAGGGKSTAMRAMALKLARQALVDETLPLPIWSKLHHWRDNRDSLLIFIQNYLKQEGLDLPGSLQALPDPEEFILLLDELDELPADNVRLLNEWTKANPNHYMIVSCRDNLYDGLRKLELPVATLQPLGIVDVFNFAKTSLQDEQLADTFVSQVFPTPNSEKSESTHISQVIKNPLFLSMLLADFKENEWGGRSAGQLEIPTIWQLFEQIIQQLWNSPRIMKKLEDDYTLNRQFSKAHEIIEHFSALVVNKPRLLSVEITEAETHLPRAILDLLDESRLILIETSGKHFRYLHPLFADFFAATTLTLEAIPAHLADPAWHQAMLILATRDSQNREAIQGSLMHFVSSNDESTSYTQLNLLGSIGDTTVIEDLITFYKRQPRKWQILRTIASIANRFSDQNPKKQQAIQLIREVMFSADWMSREVDEGYIRTGLDWYAGDFMNGAEAMALIQSPQSLEALLELLEKSSRYFENRPMGGGFIREQWFAAYLGGMGIWAIPRLLEAINSDHPDVSAAVAKALLYMQRPLDIHKLGFVLENNPNPRVRNEIAMTIASNLDETSIPYLEQALKDPGIWSRGGVIGGWKHFYVSDTAAYALAQIRGQDAQDILSKYLYERDGEPSIDLILKRLDSGLEPFGRNPIRTQLALTLAFKGRADLLLPRLGNLSNVEPNGYKEICPVANALIRYGEHQEAEPGLVHKLFDYIDSGSDDKSRAWTMVVAGHLAPIEAYPILEKYLSNVYPAAVRDATAYALGQWCARFRDQVLEPGQVASHMISLLDSVPSQGYSGVSMGLLKLLQSFSDTSIAENIHEFVRSALLDYIKAPDKNISINALDVLESLCIDKIFDVGEFSIVIQSPSYFAKLADEAHVAAAREEELPRYNTLSDGGYKIARDYYKQAIALKNNNYWEPLGYQETDWHTLGCGNLQLWFNLGRVNMTLEDWDETLIAFAHVQHLYEETTLSSPYEKAMTVFALLVSANILCNTEANKAEIKYKAALNLASTMQPGEWYLQGFAGVLLDAVRQYFLLLADRFDYKEMIVVGTLALELTKPFESSFTDERAYVVLHVAQAYGLEQDYQSAISYTRQAYDYLKRSANKDLWINFLLQKSKWNAFVDSSYDGESDALEALANARRWGSRASINTCIENLALILMDKKKLDDARGLYEEALLHHETGERLVEIDITTIYHQLANIYLGLDELDKAKLSFETAIERIKAITSEEDLPEQLVLMPFIIFADYARYLYKTGKPQIATDMLRDIARDLHSKDLPTDYPMQVLHEIDQIPGGMFSHAEIQSFGRNMIAVGMGQLDKRQLIALLQEGIMAEVSLEHAHESDFLETVTHLLETNDPNLTLPTDNPYHKQFNDLKVQYLSVIPQKGPDDINSTLKNIENLKAGDNHRAAFSLGFNAAVRFADQEEFEQSLQAGNAALECFYKIMPPMSSDFEAMTKLMEFLVEVRKAQKLQEHYSWLESMQDQITQFEKNNEMIRAARLKLELARELAEIDEFEDSLNYVSQALGVFNVHHMDDEIVMAKKMFNIIEADSILHGSSPDEVLGIARQSLLGAPTERAAYINATAAVMFANHGEFARARECAGQSLVIFEALTIPEGIAYIKELVKRMDEVEESAT